ncbi:MAG: hypothetical protein ACREMU_04685 [Gemmatimonadaceae bacterium]
MSKRIGVSIVGRELRATLVSAGKVKWCDSEAFAHANTLTDSLARLLARVPQSARRARVSIALGGEWVQVRQLGGLPSVGSIRVLTELVRQNERSFFLWRGTPSVIADLDVRSNGEVRGAAFDRHAIDAIEQAARLAHMTVRRAIPVAILGPSSTGADALAVAAALAPRRLALAWRLRPDAARTLRRARAVRAGIAAAFAATLAFAALGPGVRADLTARDAARELARYRGAADSLAHTQLELQRVSRLLARIDRFQLDRGRVTRLLAALGESTPDSTAMLTVRIDSAEGALTVIAPRAAEVLPALNAVHGLFSPRIVGSITREIVGGAQLERASIRFRRSPAHDAVMRRVSR